MSTDPSINIDEAMIHDVVYGFYDQVRQDSLIGPVFDRRIHDWPPHLEKMVDFWSAALLRTGRYHGRPGMVHLRIEELQTEHFERWLELFAATVRELCPPREAALFLEMAFRFGLGMSNIKDLAPPDRACVA